MKASIIETIKVLIPKDEAIELVRSMDKLYNYARKSSPMTNKILTEAKEMGDLYDSILEALNKITHE